MVRYTTFALLITTMEVAFLIGVSLYIDANLLTTMFFGSIVFIIVAFLMGSSDDIFTNNSEFAVFNNTFLGRARHQKGNFKLSPFFSGSLLCLGVYFVMNYFM
ncbi:hypothetical protein [Bacillus sinesaloumensis]|uniref:hypothetical protein n=1 Tax=Litchfieldia sinesaloumensis TaxID=1926280 RepID=UPI000988441F|nr:hypothetical protein [Bacillus sinesaloumensis]